MTAQDARDICQTFANRLKIVFQDHGACGFGRPCVGFMHGDSYIDYNPIYMAPPDYTSIELVPHDSRLAAPADIDAYHKHDCFAVLHHGHEDAAYDEAIKQLALWVQHLEAQGDVQLLEYATRATGVQAIWSGLVGHALVIK